MDNVHTHRLAFQNHVDSHLAQATSASDWKRFKLSLLAAAELPLGYHLAGYFH